MDYDVVVADSADGLTERLRAYFANGWQCQGGVCVSEGKFYQAMVTEIVLLPVEEEAEEG